MITSPVRHQAATIGPTQAKRMRSEIERLRAENIFLTAENHRLRGQLDEHAIRAGWEVKPHGAKEITAGTAEGPLRRTPRGRHR